MIIYQGIKLFPKKDQYAIGSRIEILILEMLELIMLANRKSPPAKLLILEKIDDKLQTLKLLIRLCTEIKIINSNKYLIWQNELQTIGCMLGGWIKATKNPANKDGARLQDKHQPRSEL